MNDIESRRGYLFALKVSQSSRPTVPGEGLHLLLLSWQPSSTSSQTSSSSSPEEMNMVEVSCEWLPPRGGEEYTSQGADFLRLLTDTQRWCSSSKLCLLCARLLNSIPNFDQVAVINYKLSKISGYWIYSAVRNQFFRQRIADCSQRRRKFHGI